MSSTGGGADGRSDWAGDFACVECGRKRLTAAAFSKRSIERHRTANVPLKCTACVEAAAAKERAAAAAKAAAAPAPSVWADPIAGCACPLPVTVPPLASGSAPPLPSLAGTGRRSR